MDVSTLCFSEKFIAAGISALYSEGNDIKWNGQGFFHTDSEGRSNNSVTKKLTNKLDSKGIDRQYIHRKTGLQGQEEKNPAPQLFNTVTEMIFCYQNCSDLLWEKIVVVIEENFEIWG